MEKHLLKKYDELHEETSKYDKTLLRLLKQGHREVINQIIKDYLSSLE